MTRREWITTGIAYGLVAAAIIWLLLGHPGSTWLYWNR